MWCALVFLFALQPDDGSTGSLDPYLKDYFERVDAAREELRATLTRRIEDLEVKIRGEAKPQKKALQQKQLAQAENSLQDLKRSKVTAYLPDHPEFRSLGALRPGKVRAVLTDQTAVIEVVHRSRGAKDVRTAYVIRVPDTRRLKVDQDFESDEVWRVMALSVEDEMVRRHLRPGYQPCIVEPVKRSEIELARQAYEAERKSGP